MLKPFEWPHLLGLAYIVMVLAYFVASMRVIAYSVVTLSRHADERRRWRALLASEFQKLSRTHEEPP